MWNVQASICKIDCLKDIWVDEAGSWKNNSCPCKGDARWNSNELKCALDCSVDPLKDPSGTVTNTTCSCLGNA